jgi:hypothetical protein
MKNNIKKSLIMPVLAGTVMTDYSQQSQKSNCERKILNTKKI